MKRSGRSAPSSSRGEEAIAAPEPSVRLDLQMLLHVARTSVAALAALLGARVAALPEPYPTDAFPRIWRAWSRCRDVLIFVKPDADHSVALRLKEIVPHPLLEGGAAAHRFSRTSTFGQTLIPKESPCSDFQPPREGELPVRPARPGRSACCFLLASLRLARSSAPGQPPERKAGPRLY